MATVVKLGSLLLDGAYAKPGAEYYPHQIISFGGENSLSWVVVDGRLIADRPLLVNISWDDLDHQHLVFGKPVTINGQQFMCRLLKVGIKDKVPNEWDAALDVAGDKDRLWHCENSSFWGQESRAVSYRAIRGGRSARSYNWTDSSRQLADIGFRPALEPLPADQLESGDMICSIGGQSVLYGSLLEITDYDAVLQPEVTAILAEADKGKLYTEGQDGLVIVDRTQMTVQRVCPM